MKCEKVMLLMVLQLNGEMEAADQTVFENHLADCPDCQKEWLQMKQLYTQMNGVSVPEPSEKMRVNFMSALNDYQRSARRAEISWWSSVQENLHVLWQSPWIGRLAFGILMLLVGLMGGFWLRPEQNNTERLDKLTDEVQQMREMMLLTLLEQPAATERLKAVSYSDKINHADERVIDALLRTLNADPNVNVRLATVEALHKMADHPKVREGLIQSITQQESPLIQTALADVMVDLQEKRAVNQFRRLLKQNELDATVKDKIQTSLQVLL